VLQQQAAVVAVWLPQGVRHMCKTASAGMRAVGCLVGILCSRQPGHERRVKQLLIRESHHPSSLTS
jgi:hypothetical protein